MPCIVKKTLNQIVASGNDFLIQLKRNCHKLHQIAQQITQTVPIDTYNDLDTQRKVSRLVEVFDCKQVLPNGWKHIQTIVKVHRTGRRNHQDFSEVSYFICSQPQVKAKGMAQGIRGHWGIENKLHWVKDVIFNEDRNKIRCPKIAANLSLMFNFALNLMRAIGFDSIKFATEHFANRVKELYNLFSECPINIKPPEN